MDEIVQKDVEKLTKEFGSSFSGNKILVTGGAGFLGSWLCDVFVQSGGKVDCLDNFSTSTNKNIEHLKGKMNVISSNVEDANLTENYDYIFDFSSRASPDEYIHHPIETLTASSIGTMKMLELAKKGNSVIVHASTSEIYGDPQVVPTPESYYGYTNSIGIRSCYDEGKRFAEALCMAYFRQHKVNVRMPRIFNTYGPRIRADGLYGRALPRIILQAMKGDQITIYGDGKQTRS
ncbi:MAG: NAD-dependent epimerase/dehydratase family protein, partial [Nitrososphaerales archaeon]